jgi:hypothetical protein
VNVVDSMQSYFLLFCLGLVFQPLNGAGQENPGASNASQQSRRDEFQGNAAIHANDRTVGPCEGIVRRIFEQAFSEGVGKAWE